MLLLKPNHSLVIILCSNVRKKMTRNNFMSTTCLELLGFTKWQQIFLLWMLLLQCTGLWSLQRALAQQQQQQQQQAAGRIVIPPLEEMLFPASTFYRLATTPTIDPASSQQLPSTFPTALPSATSKTSAEEYYAALHGGEGPPSSWPMTATTPEGNRWFMNNGGGQNNHYYYTPMRAFQQQQHEQHPQQQQQQNSFFQFSPVTAYPEAFFVSPSPPQAAVAPTFATPTTPQQMTQSSTVPVPSASPLVAENSSWDPSSHFLLGRSPNAITSSATMTFDPAAFRAYYEPSSAAQQTSNANYLPSTYSSSAQTPERFPSNRSFMWAAQHTPPSPYYRYTPPPTQQQELYTPPPIRIPYHQQFSGPYASFFDGASPDQKYWPQSPTTAYEPQQQQQPPAQQQQQQQPQQVYLPFNAKSAAHPTTTVTYMTQSNNNNHHPYSTFVDETGNPLLQPQQQQQHQQQPHMFYAAQAVMTPPSFPTSIPYADPTSMWANNFYYYQTQPPTTTAPNMLLSRGGVMDPVIFQQVTGSVVEPPPSPQTWLDATAMNFNVGNGGSLMVPLAAPPVVSSPPTMPSLVAEAFAKDGIMEALALQTAPTQAVEVMYKAAKGIVMFGNELYPSQIHDEPPFIRWPAASPTNSLYTLMLLDIDAPTSANPYQRPFIHWIIVNVPGNLYWLGKTLVKYLSPEPAANSGLHRYVFLVYEQPEFINADEPVIPRHERQARINFRLADFVVKYNLTGPVAGNFFHSAHEPTATTVGGGDVASNNAVAVDLVGVNHINNYYAGNNNNWNRRLSNNVHNAVESSPYGNDASSSNQQHLVVTRSYDAAGTVPTPTISSSSDGGQQQHAYANFAGWEIDTARTNNGGAQLGNNFKNTGRYRNGASGNGVQFYRQNQQIEVQLIDGGINGGGIDATPPAEQTAGGVNSGEGGYYQLLQQQTPTKSARGEPMIHIIQAAAPPPPQQEENVGRRQSLHSTTHEQQQQTSSPAQQQQPQRKVQTLYDQWESVNNYTNGGTARRIPVST